MYENYKNNTNTKCDFTKIKEDIIKIEDVALQVVSLLENKNLTFSKLDWLIETFDKLFKSYSLSVQKYILTNDKLCYFNIRK